MPLGLPRVYSQAAPPHCPCRATPGQRHHTRACMPTAHQCPLLHVPSFYDVVLCFDDVVLCFDDVMRSRHDVMFRFADVVLCFDVVRLEVDVR